MSESDFDKPFNPEYMPAWSPDHNDPVPAAPSGGPSVPFGYEAEPDPAEKSEPAEKPEGVAWIDPIHKA